MNPPRSLLFVANRLQFWQDIKMYSYSKYSSGIEKTASSRSSLLSSITARDIAWIIMGGALAYLMTLI